MSELLLMFVQLFRQYNDPLLATPVIPSPSSRWGNPNPLHLPHSMPGHLSADIAKREEVKEAFQWSWAAYEAHAWGDDEVSAQGCLHVFYGLVARGLRRDAERIGRRSR